MIQLQPPPGEKRTPQAGGSCRDRTSAPLSSGPLTRPTDFHRRQACGDTTRRLEMTVRCIQMPPAMGGLSCGPAIGKKAHVANCPRDRRGWRRRSAAVAPGEFARSKMGPVSP